MLHLVIEDIAEAPVDPSTKINISAMKNRIESFVF
jgi:hypothetical protein